MSERLRFKKYRKHDSQFSQVIDGLSYSKLDLMDLLRRHRGKGKDCDCSYAGNSLEILIKFVLLKNGFPKEDIKIYIDNCKLVNKQTCFIGKSALTTAATICHLSNIMIKQLAWCKMFYTTDVAIRNRKKELLPLMGSDIWKKSGKILAKTEITGELRSHLRFTRIKVPYNKLEFDTQLSMVSYGTTEDRIVSGINFICDKIPRLNKNRITFIDLTELLTRFNVFKIIHLNSIVAGILYYGSKEIAGKPVTFNLVTDLCFTTFGTVKRRVQEIMEFFHDERKSILKKEITMRSFNSENVRKEMI